MPPNRPPISRLIPLKEAGAYRDVADARPPLMAITASIAANGVALPPEGGLAARSDWAVLMLSVYSETRLSKCLGLRDAEYQEVTLAATDPARHASNGA